MSLTLILTLVVSVLSSLKLTGTAGTVTTIIDGILESIQPLLSGLENGGSSTVSPTTVLQSVAAVVAVLQADTNLSPTDLQLVQALDAALQQGIAEMKAMETEVDPSKLTQIPTIE